MSWSRGSSTSFKGSQQTLTSYVYRSVSALVFFITVHVFELTSFMPAHLFAGELSTRPRYGKSSVRGRSRCPADYYIWFGSLCLIFGQPYSWLFLLSLSIRLGWSSPSNHANVKVFTWTYRALSLDLLVLAAAKGTWISVLKRATNTTQESSVYFSCCSLVVASY